LYESSAANNLQKYAKTLGEASGVAEELATCEEDGGNHCIAPRWQDVYGLIVRENSIVKTGKSDSWKKINR
jgi:hypothetical protein